MEFLSQYSDSEIARMMREPVTEQDSTGYYLRIVSGEELENVRAQRPGMPMRWFMMPDHMVPPQAVSWMALGKGPHEYSKAILLTPEVVEKNGIFIYEYDSTVIDRWYPAVRLESKTQLVPGDYRDATQLVLDSAQGLKPDAYPLDIMRQLVLHKPSAEVLNACPPLVAGATGRTSG